MKSGSLLKLSLLFAFTMLIRLIPFRPPNIEPILAIQMPSAKAYGKVAAFSFAFLSMAIFDTLTGKLGIWTLITGVTYGLIGIWASQYLKNKKNSPWCYAKFAFMGTIAFDIITGLSIGPLFFNQSFMDALVGQIPFTLSHLLGNISFALVLSPAIYSMVRKKTKDSIPNFNILNLKIT